MELSKLESRLENGDNLSGSDFRHAADKATELYLSVVPGSDYAPPTASQQRNIPFAWGFGLGLLAMLGVGFVSYKSGRSGYY